MIHGQNIKVRRAYDPETSTSGAKTGRNVKMDGFNYLTVIAYTGDMGGTGLTAMSLEEADATSDDFVTISGTVVGTDKNIDGSTSALPSGSSTNKFWVWQLHLRPRKKYIRVAFTIDDSATKIAILNVMSRGDDLPESSSQMGAEHVLRV